MNSYSFYYVILQVGGAVSGMYTLETNDPSLETPEGYLAVREEFRLDAADEYGVDPVAVVAVDEEFYRELGGYTG